MEVKVGYKLTDVGVIPNDWNADSLISLTPMGVKNNIVDGPFGSNLKTIHYRNSGIPIITSGYVTNGKFLAERYLYVDEAKFKEEKRSAVKSGDIVMAKIGERCGASAILPIDHEEGILSGNALKITIDVQKHSNLYIWHVLWNLHCSGKLESIRTTGAQPAISMANLKNYLIPIPPTKDEEDKIAEALSDADALIESLEKLIEKKRQIKQGAMQELLTGKKRLPGFSGEWQVRKLGDVAEVIMGQSPSSKFYNKNNEGIPLIQGNADIENRKAIKRIFTTDVTKRGFQGDILMSVRAPVGEVSKTEFDICLGRGVCAIKGNNFLYHLLISKEKDWLKLSKGSTFDSVNSAEVKSFELFVPQDIDEQSEIAQIFDDLDLELSELESKLTKTRQIKQGMMQELLTGRVRLV